MINGQTGEVDDECPHFQCHMDKFSPPLIHYDNVIEQKIIDDDKFESRLVKNMSVSLINI